MNLWHQRLKQSSLADIAEKVRQNQRLSLEEGIRLFETPDLLSVGYLAHIVRERKNGPRAHFIRNQHINYTNICVNGCQFCAFSREKGEMGGYTMTLEEVFAKVKERLPERLSEVHIVGGLNEDLPYQYYLDMMTGIRRLAPEIHIQAFTCVEIAYIAQIAQKSVVETLKELKAAGLDSLPGGGAEVFSSRIRQSLCEKKLPGNSWLEVAQAAHRLGMKSNATMLYGHVETVAERVEHLLALRAAQDETGGFLAFIPLAFHAENTKMPEHPPTTGFDDLKMLAVSRLMLDNFPHIKCFWIMVGTKIAQIGLAFGADDIDGTVMEERITHDAGAKTPQALSRAELVSLIKGAGCVPAERDTVYNILKEG
jgi:aminodeoxyfutalosine synthase